MNKVERLYLKLIKEGVADEVPAEVPETPVEEGVKVVTFKTADQALIDALNNGFEKVVFSVVNPDGKEGELTEVEVGKDAITEVTVTDDAEAPVAEDDETVEECDEPTSEEDTVDEEDTKCEACNGTGKVQDESGDDCDCQACNGTGVCECGDVESEQDQEVQDPESAEECDEEDMEEECDEEDMEEECDDVATEKSNAFESALARIKAKYLLK